MGVESKSGEGALPLGDEKRAIGIKQFPEVHKLLLRWILLGKAALGVIGWTIVGLAAGAASAGVFGLLIGLLNGLLYLEPLWIFACGTYFSLCGAAAGGLLGGSARLLDPIGMADLANDLRQWRRVRGPHDRNRRSGSSGKPGGGTGTQPVSSALLNCHDLVRSLSTLLAHSSLPLRIGCTK
jgi:hypothetical protein